MTKFTLNGKIQSFTGDPEMPLLWYLRDIAGLTGTKFGCGQALCGACTVHIDGTAARSCQTRMGDIGDRVIITIEGLSHDGTHPLQVAWRELNVAQCGYCQGGQIMQAASLLKETPKPIDRDIDAAMSGNICRCGTYPRVRAAIKRAADTGDLRRRQRKR
jgi:isoquinoline 1-oxidoreductase subunit alpha